MADATLDRPWDDRAVPLEARGVSPRWILDFVRGALDEVNRPRRDAIELAERARSHNRAGLWGMHDQPDMPEPAIPPCSFLTTHGLVSRVVKPLTLSRRAPLYALVPDEFRGPPTTFVSHTWSSLLLGPEQQPIGTLDALDDCGHEFVWIDFACYNQHTFEAIATDMLRVIGAIGSVSVCATPTPIYTRSWCLWELLCGHRAESRISLVVHPGFRNDKIMSVNALYRSFRGIDTARSSVARDAEVIRNECVAHFGSVERADAEFEALIREKFSGSWHELQDRNERMQFSPTPWVAGAGGVAPAAFEPYFEPGLMESRIFGSDQTVRDAFAEAGVYLHSADAEHVTRERTQGVWESLGERTQSFFAAIVSRDAEAVKEHLALGTEPDIALGGITPLTVAAAAGDTSIVDMLIVAGAPIDSTRTALSPLRVAADKGQLEVVRLLLRHGAAVDGQSAEDGWPALMWASASGHDEIVRALLAARADVNHAGSGKRARALHLAAQDGRADVVRTLLEHGAEIDAREYRGLTALHLAAYRGHADIVAVLLSHGADVTAQGSQGETARGLAEDAGHPHVVEALDSTR